MKKTIYTSLVAIALSLGFTSCDNYLDINDDPNSPAVSNLDASLLFPGAELAFCNSYGDYLRITGGYFAEHYSQYFGTSNYLDYSQFMQSAVRSSSTYTNLCVRALTNLETCRTLSAQNEDWGTYLAATVLRAATFQALVDCYGSVPYTEALDAGNVLPKYDEGPVVYKGIVAEIDDALSKATASMPVCTNFLHAGKTADQWIKTANALKLRILMRMSGVEDVKGQLASLISENNFPTQDVAWEGFWSNASGQANPFYQEEFATYFGSTQTNVALNLALLTAMNAADDPRLEAFFNPNTEGKYWGGVSGTNFSTSNSYKAPVFCRPNMKYDSPVYLITVSEIEFFKAEYAMKFGNAADGQAHYEAAIRASFATAGIADDPSSTVLAAYPWNASDYKRLIGIQKWVALSGVNNFEAYCEMRRMGYPAFGKAQGSDIYNILTDAYDATLLTPGELYTPIQCNAELGSNKLLQRWPYPESSANRNSNAPKYDGDASPIFWAK